IPLRQRLLRFALLALHVFESLREDSDVVLELAGELEEVDLASPLRRRLRRALRERRVHGLGALEQQIVARREGRVERVRAQRGCAVRALDRALVVGERVAHLGAASIARVAVLLIVAELVGERAVRGTHRRSTLLERLAERTHEPLDGERLGGALRKE